MEQRPARKTRLLTQRSAYLISPAALKIRAIPNRRYLLTHSAGRAQSIWRPLIQSSIILEHGVVAPQDLWLEAWDIRLGARQRSQSNPLSQYRNTVLRCRLLLPPSRYDRKVEIKRLGILRYDLKDSYANQSCNEAVNSAPSFL